MYTLTTSLTEHSKMIRQKVFVEEQNFTEEFDEKDNNSRHIVLYEGTKPTATCRFYKNSADGEFIIGRVAVLPEYRSKNYGKKIMEIAEKSIAECGGEKAKLSSQIQAKVFYEKCGYSAFGDTFLEQDCPHINMNKNLK